MQIFNKILIILIFMLFPNITFACVNCIVSGPFINHDDKQCALMREVSNGVDSSIFYKYELEKKWEKYMAGNSDFNLYCEQNGYTLIQIIPLGSRIKVFTGFFWFSIFSASFLIVLVFVTYIKRRKLKKDRYSVIKHSGFLFSDYVEHKFFFIFPFLFSSTGLYLLNGVGLSKKLSLFIFKYLFLGLFFWTVIFVIKDIAKKEGIFYVYFLNFILGLILGFCTLLFISNI